MALTPIGGSINAQDLNDNFSYLDLEKSSKNEDVTISSKPIEGDFSKIHRSIYTISGSDTAGTPTTGYVYTNEIIPSFITLNTTSGHNESTDSNNGRTGMPVYRTVINHNGNGDAVTYNGRVYVGGTKTGSTHWLANPAGVLINGDVVAGADGVFLNGSEFHIKDEGYDTAAIGQVMSFTRNNSTGSKDVVWIGSRFQSNGTEYIDSGYSLSGNWKVGLDFTPATFDSNKVAIALKANDRIYLNASSTADSQGIKWYANNLNNTYIDYDSATQVIRLVVNNAASLQVKNTNVTSPVYFNTAADYRHNGTKVVGARQTGWGTPTGTATRTTFDTATVTTAQLAERVKALIDDLTTHGLIGA